MQVKSFQQRLSAYLSSYTDGHVLGLVRLLFSLLMVYEMIDYIKIDLVYNMFIAPKANFKYDGLHWVVPFSEPVMDGIMWVLLGLSILMAAGIWFKWAARLFALGYAYIFLIDTSIYNNHIYLFILLALLLSFTHADHFFSLRKNKVAQLQRWEPFMIQFQLVIVYVYAALVKVKYDWMVRQEPVRTMAAAIGPDHWMHPFVKNEAVIYFVNYGGFLLDLLTPVLLWYKPARKVGIPMLVLFHLSNSQLFNDIGIFPFVMLAALVIFYDTEEVPFLRKWATTGTALPNSSSTGWQWEQPALRLAFIVYFAFQLLFPWRGFFLPNDMDWTTIGNRFSWRVKADTRLRPDINFEVVGADGQVTKVDVNAFVNTHQIRTLLTDPRATRDLVKVIDKFAKAQGYTVTAVRASIRFGYNGKPSQNFIVPSVDLTKVTYSPFKKLDWVVDPLPSK